MGERQATSMSTHGVHAEPRGQVGLKAEGVEHVHAPLVEDLGAEAEIGLATLEAEEEQGRVLVPG